MKKIKFLNKDTGNLEEHINQNPSRWDAKGNLIDKNGRSHASDHNRICCEVYNRGKEPIMFINQENNLDIKILQPDEFLFLPHKYFIAFTPSGEPCNVVLNHGDQMFKGNKLPSRPEVKKIMVGGK